VEDTLKILNDAISGGVGSPKIADIEI